MKQGKPLKISYMKKLVKVYFSWKELLPELLNVIIEKEFVEYNDIEMRGVDYKTELINSLCMFEWSSNIVILLAVMFM